jgi:hypothetical protein
LTGVRVFIEPRWRGVCVAAGFAQPVRAFPPRAVCRLGADLALLCADAHHRLPILSPDRARWAGLDAPAIPCSLNAHPWTVGVGWGPAGRSHPDPGAKSPSGPRTRRGDRHREPPAIPVPSAPAAASLRALRHHWVPHGAPSGRRRPSLRPAGSAIGAVQSVRPRPTPPGQRRPYQTGEASFLPSRHRRSTDPPPRSDR